MKVVFNSVLSLVERHICQFFFHFTTLVTEKKKKMYQTVIPLFIRNHLLANAKVKGVQIATNQEEHVLLQTKDKRHTSLC